MIESNASMSPLPRNRGLQRSGLVIEGGCARTKLVASSEVSVTRLPRDGLPAIKDAAGSARESCQADLLLFAAVAGGVGGSGTPNTPMVARSFDVDALALFLGEDPLSGLETLLRPAVGKP